MIDCYCKNGEELRIWEPFFHGKASLTFQAGWDMAERDRQDNHRLPIRLKEALAALECGIPVLPPEATKHV